MVGEGGRTDKEDACRVCQDGGRQSFNSLSVGRPRRLLPAGRDEFRGQGDEEWGSGALSAGKQQGGCEQQRRH